ncbi:MAG TPA: Fe-S cluster assembly protein HesB [Microbacteriaceae bacterium]|jgi:Fe-S cluster assembly iron-binding protein IscA|nr:Fe-S cluster assembly protein HesB [Microbacteriaceae bacterium]
MLTLTDSASTAVKSIAGRNDDTHEAGLRISTEPIGGTDFSVAITPAPEPTDTVVESAGAKVFLEQNAAAALDGKILDAQTDDDGSVRFAISNRD